MAVASSYASHAQAGEADRKVKGLLILTRFRGHPTLGEKEFSMPQRCRPQYPEEFRRQIVELVRIGRSPEELAKEFEPSAQTIRNWVKQIDLDAGRRHDGLTSAERKEIVELRRENRRLREEREILSRAAAWFAQETNSTSTRRSSSSKRTGLNSE
jgi:transposase